MYRPLFADVCQIAAIRPLELFLMSCAWPEPSYSLPINLAVTSLEFQTMRPGLMGVFLDNGPYVDFIKSSSTTLCDLTIKGHLLDGLRDKLVTGIQAVSMPQLKSFTSQVTNTETQWAILHAILVNHPTIRALSLHNQLAPSPPLPPHSAPQLSSIKALMPDLLELIPGRPVVCVEVMVSTYQPIQPPDGYQKLAESLLKSRAPLIKLDLAEAPVQISAEDVSRTIDSHLMLEEVKFSIYRKVSLSC